MKRFVAILLAAALVAPAFAQAPTVSALKGKTVEVVVWTHEDSARTALEKRLIDEFTKANPGVTVKYVTYPSGKIKDIVVAGFAANAGPDIFNLEIFDQYQFIANGRVAPVDYKLAGFKSAKDMQAKYMAGMLDPVTEDGKIYGMPLELTNWAVYLNKKIFRDAGLDPMKDYPKTWEEVMAVSEKIVKRDGQIITRRGFDFRYPYYLTSVVPMVEQLGGELVSKDGKSVVTNDAAWLKVLAYFKDFGPNGKNLGSPTYTAARKVFDNDKNEIAMSLSGLYQEARMRDANPTFYNSGEWMVVPFPQWKDAVRKVPNNYYGHYYMVNAQSSKLEQQAAWALLGYMLQHGEEYLEKVAIVQPTKALFESRIFKETPYSKVFEDDMAAGHIVYYGAASSKIESLLKEAFESVMLSGVEPAKALDKLRRDVKAALEDI
ncbi:MAG TPA: extracellular solute-binding protein [Spirochaetales bacterium]|nr:extracellular solute-binding protein [Spirochaetales bacterium]HPG86819.1 extracellular solute-binding protein [Spirochaetales bacterium]HQO65523.1 extracellular solute-binding protein [Spirochaetales bacterium]